jgi:hypothetical protein
MLDKEGNFILDDGTFGDDAQPVEELPVRVGRPLDTASLNYEDIDPFIDFYLLNPKQLTQRVLLGLIRHVYARKYRHSPSVSTLKERIRLLKSRPR